VSASDAGLVGQVTSQTGAMAAAGSTGLANVAPIGHRDAIVSRDSRRDALADAANEALVEQAEAQAEQQHAALKQFAKAAEKQAAKIKENQWILPLESYRITATFGLSSYLWSSVHTGLDFSAAAARADVKAKAKPAREIPSLEPGDRVLHDSFGMGTVVALEGAGDKSVASIDFGSEGVKRLLLRYAPVEKL
jgi:hypothetical protein